MLTHSSDLLFVPESLSWPEYRHWSGYGRTEVYSFLLVSLAPCVFPIDRSSEALTALHIKVTRIEEMTEKILTVKQILLVSTLAIV